MQSYAIMALEFCYFFIFYFHMIIINDLRVFNASEVHVGSSLIISQNMVSIYKKKMIFVYS